MKTKKEKIITVRLTKRELEYLQGKIVKKELFFESLKGVPLIKMSPALMLRELLWICMERDGIKCI